MSFQKQVMKGKLFLNRHSCKYVTLKRKKKLTLSISTSEMATNGLPLTFVT